MKKIEVIYKDNSNLTKEFQNNFSKVMSEIITVEKLTGKEISPDHNKHISELTSEFHNVIPTQLSEILAIEKMTVKEVTSNHLKSFSGNLAIYNQNKEEYWLLNEDFPIGDFYMYVLEDNNLACVIFNGNLDILKWEKAKLSRLHYSFNQKPVGLTTDVKKQFILPDANFIDIGDVETLITQNIRFEFDTYPDSGQYKYNDPKMLITEDAAINSYQNVLDISFNNKDGVFFPFIGYDSEENIACLLFHFKSNSEVMEDR